MSVTTTPASLTVAGGSSPRAMGIAAPTDSQYPASKLKITVTGLPIDGTIYLSDGVTPVLPGELLSVEELTGLTFAGGAGATGQSAQFTYEVTDPAGTSATGTATLSVVANTDGPQTSPASLTVIANTGATAINITAPTDPNDSANNLTITVLGLPPDGSVVLADGVTIVTAGQSLTAGQLTGLKFTPDAGVVAESSLFSYRVTDPAGNSSLGSAILSIAPAGNILTVGPGRQYSTIAAAIAASHNGDTIQVQAGTYVNDFAAINTNITLEGIGGMVNMVCTMQIPNGKAIFVTNGDITINNFSFSGAQVADANGAGIRYETGNLVLNNDAFFNNQDGLLSASDPSGSITINNSEFADNGIGDGKTHNLYVGAVGTLTIDHSYFHDANVGHEIKSRALNTTITNSRIYDGAAGTASYSIDLPNGGNAVIQNNVIEQGPLSENSIIITIGEEGGVYASTSLTVSGNTILNDLSSSSSLALRNTTTATAQITGNQFFGLTSTQIVSGPNVQSNNQFLASEPTLDLTHPWSPEIAITATNQNEPPTINSNGGGATASVSVAENTTAVTTVMATDPDAGQTLGFSIAGGVDAALFTINATTGALGFVTAPNFEAPADAGANNIYDVTVQVSDGAGGLDTQTIAVTVTNVAGATIIGTNQGQTLTGTGEEDFIYGLGGNDTLEGLAGSDYLDGGAGTDTATYAMSPAGISVSLETGMASGGDAAGDTLVNIENLTGSTFNDTLEGDAGNNVLAGGPGADTVSYEHATAGVTVDLAQTRGQNTGGAGTDKLSGFENLTGSAFDDVLTGSSAANTLIGLDGNDVLTGGDGADTLTGGVGADRFVFTATSNSSPNAPDIITDFTHGTDIIDLSAIDANSSPKAKGDQAFTFSGLNSNVVANSVTWSESGGNTIIRADVNGNSTADFTLVLAGINHNLTGSDFNL